MKQPLRAGLYARVSTADQQTLPLQTAAMREYALRRGWEIVVSSNDVNGGTKHRPKREELIRMAKQRKLDVIVVWRLDRWGRSLSDLTTTLEELRALKVDFVSVTEGLDFTTPSGRALAGMLGIFAEFERDILRERVRAGMEHARTKGVVLGRPATAQAQADQIHQLLEAGMSKKAVARKLGIGRASIYRAIEKEDPRIRGPKSNNRPTRGPC